MAHSCALWLRVGGWGVISNAVAGADLVGTQQESVPERAIFSPCPRVLRQACRYRCQDRWPWGSWAQVRGLGVWPGGVLFSWFLYPGNGLITKTG